MYRTPPVNAPVIAFLIVLFGFSFSAYSQENHAISHYTNENGLPANGIKGIELDRENGFLWIGTQAGIVRFDGKHFTVYPSQKKAGAAFRITVIAKNRQGKIFFEDENFSVYRIRNNQPEFVMTDTILMDPTYIRGGSSPRRPAKKIVEKLKQLPSSSFLLNSIVFHDDTGDSSSFTFNYFGNACHYDAKEDSLHFFEGDQNFQSVLKLNGRVFFVRENPEIWELDKKTKRLFPVKLENMPAWNEKDAIKPLFIWKPMMEAPLLVYDQRIWKLQTGAGSQLRLEPVCFDCYPPNADIRSVQIWKEQGLMFLGSEANGLFVVKSPFLRTIRSDTSTIAGKPEYAQVEIAPGIFYTASGLSYEANGKLLPGALKISFPQSNIYQNKQGDCWYTSVDVDTIIHYHRQSNKYTRMEFRGAHRMVFAETRDRLFAIADIGIAEITDDQFKILYRLPPRSEALKNSINPTAAIEWKPGLLALAGEKLLFFDTERASAPDTVHIPGLAAQVRALKKYGDYLFIGTYGEGCYIYRNGVIKKMPPDKHNYLAFTHCFLPDDKGYCWISTNHGIFKASLDAMITAWEKDLPEIYYHYFGKDDGIFNTEFNGGCQPCALKTSSGIFSFPSMNGVVMVDPAAPHLPPPSGKLFVDEILIDTAPMMQNDGRLMELPHDVRNIRFKISLPQFRNPENIYFSYKLDPYDNWETQDILQNNLLQFGGLPPGTYRLDLKLRNGFRMEDYHITSVQFRILKPWYSTSWFYLLCMAGMALLVWALVKWRTHNVLKKQKELKRLVSLQTSHLEIQSKQLADQLQQLQNQQLMLEEDNKVKTRLIAIMSHDMVSPLKFMGFMAKKLRNLFPASDKAYQTADSFVTVTGELESLTVNMLNWIRFHQKEYALQPEVFDLASLVTTSTDIVAALAKEKGLALQIDILPDTTVCQYRQALSVIIYNLAMNAMKYTENGAISISGGLENGRIWIAVSDTGKGMMPELVEQLNRKEPLIYENKTGDGKKFRFGHAIIKDLLQLVKGAITVESKLQRGSRVKINCPDLDPVAGSEQEKNEIV